MSPHGLNFLESMNMYLKRPVMVMMVNTCDDASQHLDKLFKRKHFIWKKKLVSRRKQDYRGRQPGTHTYSL